MKRNMKSRSAGVGQSSSQGSLNKLDPSGKAPASTSGSTCNHG